MKQWTRHSVALAGSGILGVSFSFAAQAASLGPGAPTDAASGAAWVTATTGPLEPAAATVLAWGPPLLVATLGAILAVLIWLQPRAPAGEQRNRRNTGKPRATLTAVETWRSAVPKAQAPANGSLQRTAAGAALEGALGGTLDGTTLSSAVKR